MTEDMTPAELADLMEKRCEEAERALGNALSENWYRISAGLPPLKRLKLENKALEEMLGLEETP